MCIVYTTVVHIINDRTIKEKNRYQINRHFFENNFLLTHRMWSLISCIDMHSTRVYL